MRGGRIDGYNARSKIRAFMTKPYAAFLLALAAAFADPAWAEKADRARAVVTRTVRSMMSLSTGFDSRSENGPGP